MSTLLSPATSGTKALGGNFQALALGHGEEGIQRREAFATKLRKAKKSELLKGKRDALSKKSTDLPPGERSVVNSVKNSPGATAEDKPEPAPAVDMNELF